MTRFPLAERFFAPQGEGLYAGTQMAFARLVGCSVGQEVCVHCDTDFDRVRTDLGGGLYAADEILAWANPIGHLCLTGGEPLDRDVRPILHAAVGNGVLVHVETSGTTRPHWLDPRAMVDEAAPSMGQATHAIEWSSDPEARSSRWSVVPLWVCVSPKPGWLQEMIESADEIKVILGGLGDGPGWPTVDDARRWAGEGRLVFVQPRNGRMDVDGRAMGEALEIVAKYPELRLSAQLHKFLRTR